jgi:hypothetical protein
MLSPSSLEMVSGFWRASIDAASLGASVQVKKCARISQGGPPSGNVKKKRFLPLSRRNAASKAVRAMAFLTSTKSARSRGSMSQATCQQSR